MIYTFSCRPGVLNQLFACFPAAPDLVLNAQVVEQTTYLEDRPMYTLQCAHEEKCLSKTADKVDPTTSYRRLLRFSSQIHNNGLSDFRPRAAHHSWIWHECHRWETNKANLSNYPQNPLRFVPVQ